jgi:DNA-binding PadR family transcriptional regulator
MDDAMPTRRHGGPGSSRFGFAPPRRFLLPAILLLLSESPGHGYSLDRDLRELDFGKIDRPSVYRALAELEKDGLVESWSEAPPSGHERRVYGMTPRGEQALGVWMSVIKEERDLLARVLRRYQATGTPDAILAEVDGGWASALGSGWSPVLPTAAPQRHLKPVGADRPDRRPADGDAAAPPGEGASTGPAAGREAPAPTPAGTGGTAATRRFHLSPDRSVVLIEARSTVGPISFGAIGITGHVDAAVRDGAVDTTMPPSARIDIAVGGLRSGNSLYDAELLRRIDARRFSTARLSLRECAAGGVTGRYSLAGELTFHGVARPVHGSVDVAVRSDGRLVVTGEQVIDIRDFDVPSPTVLMLRIYPDVRVHLHVEADLEEGQ